MTRPAPPLEPRLLARDAAAGYCGVGSTTFDALVSSGVMPPAKVVSAGRLAWDRRELDAAIDNLPHKGGAARSDADEWAAA